MDSDGAATVLGMGSSPARLAAAAAVASKACLGLFGAGCSSASDLLDMSAVLNYFGGPHMTRIPLGKNSVERELWIVSMRSNS